MSGNLTLVDGKGLVSEVNGTTVRITDARVYAREDMWHEMGYVNAGGLYLDEAKHVIDPKNEMEIELVPTGMKIKNRFVRDGHAAVIANSASDTPWIYGKVEVGDMSRREWETMNKGQAGYTKSKKYEVVTPNQAVALMDRVIRNPDDPSKRVKASSMGFLGTNGEDGMFVSIPMPSWDGNVQDALGTKDKQYLIMFVTYKGYMRAHSSTTLVVCQNTLMMSIANAETSLKTGHSLGAEDRLEQALTGVYEGALHAREMTQKAMLHLLNTPMSIDQVQKMADDLYVMPGLPDKTLIGKKSMAQRMINYNSVLNGVVGEKEAFVQIVEEPMFHQMAGITPQMVNTAMAPMQAKTFLGTFGVSKNKNNLIKQMITGPRGQGTQDGLNWLLKETKFSNN